VNVILRNGRQYQDVARSLIKFALRIMFLIWSNGGGSDGDWYAANTKKEN